MKAFYTILNALRLLLTSTTAKETRLEEIDDNVIAEHSWGNIFFQFAKYYTRADVDRELKEVAKYNFS